VTIFRLDKKRNSAADVEAGKRGFLRLRTLRHPHVLACIDGAELDGEVVLATEPVVSLRSWMSVRVVGSESHADAVAWGMYCLCNALRFIHMDCKLAHCNINLDTVFVTPGGDWRLGGMDLLGPMDASNTILYGGGNLTPPEFQCPERRQGSIQSLLSGGLPIYTQDTWALGSLLKSCYGGQPPPDVLRYVDKLQVSD
jgi:SCY1-like protein 1